MFGNCEEDENGRLWWKGSSHIMFAVLLDVFVLVKGLRRYNWSLINS